MSSKNSSLLLIPDNTEHIYIYIYIEISVSKCLVRQRTASKHKDVAFLDTSYSRAPSITFTSSMKPLQIQSITFLLN